jgi:microcystin-dependent protein
MAEPFIGEIRIFGFTFAPQDWAQCNGAPVGVQQNTALFSLLGTTYGGDGRRTFNLPNLSGLAPAGAGQGPGLSGLSLGQSAGAYGVTLAQGEMPSHGHALNGAIAAASVNEPTPTGNSFVARFLTEVPTPAVAQNLFTPGGNPTTTFAQGAVGTSGNSGPHENRQPFLALNFCICLSGVYPTFS